jgi:hypothetical protein
MSNKLLIGTEAGEAVAAFVQRIEEQTGKSLKAVHTRQAEMEPVVGNKDAVETSVTISLEFFQTPPPH